MKNDDKIALKQIFIKQAYTEKTVLLKNLKFSWIQIRKVILLKYQNNYVER